MHNGPPQRVVLGGCTGVKFRYVINRAVGEGVCHIRLTHGDALAFTVRV
jgi:hypothetical protein